MPVKVQPYQPPQSELTTEPVSVRVFRISQPMWLMAYLYPLALVGSLYGTWLLAWWELGHVPRPDVDDPKSIGGILSVCCHVPLLVAMLFPIMLPLGFVASFYLGRTRGRPMKLRWWLLPAIYLLFCFLVYFTISRDPLKVVVWYAD